MRSIKCSLFIVFQLVYWCQYVNSENVKLHIHQIAPFETPSVLAKDDHDIRGIKDIWNNIKQSTVNAWSFVKNVANNTKNKINNWMKNVKERAEEITKGFKCHMKELKKKVHDLIMNTFGNSELVKKCIEKENNELQSMITQITKQMTTCISNKLNNLSVLSQDLLVSTAVNDTDFIRELEDKFKTCEQDPDNAEECLNKVRDDVLYYVENTENDLLKDRIDSRNVMDDLVSAIMACSIDGLIEASSIITIEAAKITKCIIKGDQIDEGSQKNVQQFI